LNGAPIYALAVAEPNSQSAPKRQSFRDFASFKIDHFEIEIRPLVVKTGQYPPSHLSKNAPRLQGIGHVTWREVVTTA
jgi:hypothetical protein